MTQRDEEETKWNKIIIIEIAWAHETCRGSDRLILRAKWGQFYLLSCSSAAIWRLLECLDFWFWLIVYWFVRLSDTSKLMCDAIPIAIVSGKNNGIKSYLVRSLQSKSENFLRQFIHDFMTFWSVHFICSLVIDSRTCSGVTSWWMFGKENKIFCHKMIYNGQWVWLMICVALA